MPFLYRVLSLLLAASAAQASSLRGLEEETSLASQEANIVWRRPGHPQRKYCRCEAPWEHYYIKEYTSNSTDTNSTNDRRRGLLQAGIDIDGFYIVDRVRVVPCDKYGNPIANLQSLVAGPTDEVAEERGGGSGRRQRHRRNFENVYGKGKGSSKSGGSSKRSKGPLPPTFPCPTPSTPRPPVAPPPPQPTPTPPTTPTFSPTAQPSAAPSPLQIQPAPTRSPDTEPSTQPSGHPSSQPSGHPSAAPSASPSFSPSSAPSPLQILPEPTSAPSSFPSRFPTGDLDTFEPTPFPTFPPLGPPTRRPTLPPAPVPTRRPTRGPTPTGATCDIDVDLKCTTAMNMNCEDLETIRNLRCIVPTDLLTFSYNPRTCDAASNSQGERADCETFESYNPIRQARVDCAVNGKRAWVTPAQVSVGQAFQVHAVGSTLLTGSLACVFSDLSGEIMQAVSIDLTGVSRLDLKDSFGSIQVEGCGTKNCIEQLSYTADVTNRGSGSVDVDVYMEVGSSTKLLAISNPVPSGQTRTSSAYETILDICSSSYLPASVFVSGVSLLPPFDTCEATDTLRIGQSDAPSAAPSHAPSFQTGGECDVEAELTCLNAKNIPCTDIKPPVDVRCAMPNMNLYTLHMRYVPTACGIRANQQGDKYLCRDNMPISPTATVNIECYESELITNAMEVRPPKVSPGTVFAMSRARVGNLPTNVTCKVKTIPNDMSIQTVTFDTSGKVELDLKDRFGSFQVEGCDSRSCLDTWNYTAVARNAGIGNVFMQDFQIQFSGEDPINLLTEKDRVTRLTPGAELTATPFPPKTVDICESKNYSATVSASALREGDRPGSATCDAQTTLPLNLVPPCNIKVDLTCTATEDDGYQDADCRSIALEENLQCRCSPCARELRFRYTAAPCPSSDSAGFSCKNVTNMNPMDRARVLVRRRFTDLYDAEVETGKDIIVNSGECVPDDLVFFVMNPGTAIVTQKFSLDTRCSDTSGGIRLLGSYGAFQFSGYSCGDKDNEKHNCYVNVTQGVCAENDGTQTRTLSRFELNLNDDENPFDLIKTASATDKKLLAGQDFCNETVTTEIQRCRETKYAASATAYADPNSCVANKVYGHDVVRGTRFPTPVPTLQIEPEPTSPSSPVAPTPPRPQPTPAAPTPTVSRPTPIAPTPSTPSAPTPTAPIFPTIPGPRVPSPPDSAPSPSNNCMSPQKPVFCP